MRLQRKAQRHQTTAVTSEDFWIFAPGDRVMTPEGFAGTVDSVEDGPFQGFEQYLVTLDAGMGGGEYAEQELSPLDPGVTASVEVAQVAEYVVPMPVEGAIESGLHMASEDYPELSEILLSRPPLTHSEPLRMSATKTAGSIPALPEWAIEQQFEQYPSSGPDGVSYFKGEIDADNHVDCLLYYQGGKLVGVLNHYPKDMGPERKGNVLLLVLPTYRLQGIGKALWAEAVSRWNVTMSGQDQTPDGRAFKTSSAPCRNAKDGEHAINKDGFCMLCGGQFSKTATASEDEQGADEHVFFATAGLWDHVLAPLVEKGTQYLDDQNVERGPDGRGSWSYDWCFPPEAPVALADGSERQISQMQVGDRVITHTGAVQSVTWVGSRPYEGDLVQVAVHGDRTRLITATPEHKVWAWPKGSGVPDWVALGDLRPGDRMSRSTLTEEIPLVVTLQPEHIKAKYRQVIEVKVDEPLAWVLGYYAGDGFPAASTGFEIAFCVKEGDLDTQARLTEVAGHLGATIATYPERETKAVRVIVTSQALWLLCVTLVGRGSRSKHLDERLLTMPLSEQREFVAGYQRADGNLHRSGRHVIDSISGMPIQVREMLSRLGVLTNLRTLTRRGFGVTSVSTRLEWWGGKNRLRRHFQKDGQTWMEVRSTERVPYQGDVWDIEVEEDHSFRAYGVNVHNCRFRKNRRCYFPKQLDAKGTEEAGYAVWIPEDRGLCERDKWEQQKACPVGEPGSKSGDPNAMVDATERWEDGGQRRRSSLQAPIQTTAAFEFTANWSDVRAKAKRIRSEGGVRIISLPGTKETGLTVVAEVRGDSDVYETTLVRSPGKQNVAMWSCGCAWAAYSWGRSGRWKKWEGRMCFLPDTMVSMADGTHKPIQDVRPGDRVLTHDGVGTVLNLWENSYHGDVVGLTRTGSSRQVWATADHGMLANISMRGNAGPPSTKTYRDRKNVQDKDSWGRVEAGALLVGDWLMGTYSDAVQDAPSVSLSDLHHHVVVLDGRGRLETPSIRSKRIYSGVSLPEFAYTESFAVLLGYYLAEGNVEHYNVHGVPRIVTWTFGAGEGEYVEEVVGALDALGAGTAKVYRSDSRATVKVSNATLALLLARLTGTHAATKCLHPDLMQAPLEFQETLLRTYLNGDGCESRAGTASLELARQLVTVGARLGHYIPRQAVSINNLGPANRTPGNPMYYVETAGRFMQGRERLWENFYGSRVTGVERRDYCGPVYNLNVGDQHTYAVEDTVVFNCAHALALSYEAQSQGMFGGTVKEEPANPSWRSKEPTRPGEHQRSPARNELGLYASLHPVSTDPDLHYSPSAMIAQAMLADGHPAGQVLEAFGSESIMREAINMRFRDLKALVRGTVRKIKVVFADDGEAETTDGIVVPVAEILYPSYHPSRGLTASLEKDNDPDGGVHYPYDVPWADPSRLGQPFVFGDDLFLFETDNAHEMEQGDPLGAASIEWPVTAGLEKTANFDVPDDADVDEAADFLMKAAEERADYVTAMLSGLVREHDGKMDTFEFRLKKRPRLKEKIEQDVVRRHVRPDQAAEDFNDALRFTALLPAQTYSESVEDILSDLSSRGVKPMSGTMVKNYWLRGDPYDGVNGVFRLADGFPFELQFHTEASLDLKMQNHDLYEEFRRKNCPASRRKELWGKMVSDTHMLERPPGESSIGMHTRHYLGAVTPLYVYYAFIDRENPDEFTGVFRRVETPDDVRFERYSNSAGTWVIDNTLAKYLVHGDPTVEEVPETLAMEIVESTSDLPGAALLAADKATKKVESAHDEAIVVEALMDPDTAPEMAEAITETLASDPPLPGDPRLAWLMSDVPGGGAGAGGKQTDNAEIATAAKAFLAKQALKNFTPAERAEIIEEGLDVQAGNLGDLDIAGTHYESLEATLAAQEDDEGWLS